MAIANRMCVSFCNQPKAHFSLPWVCPWESFWQSFALYLVAFNVSCSGSVDHTLVLRGKHTSGVILVKIIQNQIAKLQN